MLAPFLFVKINSIFNMKRFYGANAQGKTNFWVDVLMIDDSSVILYIRAFVGSVFIHGMN